MMIKLRVLSAVAMLCAAAFSARLGSCASCPLDVSGGIEWEPSAPDTTRRQPCQIIDSRHFPKPAMASRHCSQQGGGLWEPVDFSSCLVEGLEHPPLLLLWMMLTGSYKKSYEKELTETLLDSLLQSEAPFITNSNSPSLWTKDLSTPSQNLTSVTFRVDLDPSSSTQPLLPAIVDEFASMLFSQESISLELETFSISSTGRGHHTLIPDTTCDCVVTSNGPIVTSTRLCPGDGYIPPCVCMGPSCQCNKPYVGDNSSCTLDRDGDGFPDIPLSSCTSETNSDANANYCVEDVCPEATNPMQNPTDCQNIDGYVGCPFAVDLWGFPWINTPYGETALQKCRDGPNFATRLCNAGKGKWDDPNVMPCTSYQSSDIISQADAFLKNESKPPHERLEEASELSREIAELSREAKEGGMALLPEDLLNYNRYIEEVLDLLEETIQEDESLEGTVSTQDLIDIFNNFIDSTNLIGWEELQETDPSFGAELLLNTAERYGIYLSNAQEDVTSRSTDTRSNIAVSTNRHDPRDGKWKFPIDMSELNGTSFTTTPASIRIPEGFLEERRQKMGPDKSTVSLSVLLMRNMEQILSTNETNVASIIMSTQVAERKGMEDSPALQTEPVTVTFTIENATLVNQTYSCAFWNDSSIGGGRWDSRGVTTVSVSDDGAGNVVVECNTTHLTSFAVLVDVSGATGPSDDNTTTISEAELKALQIVSYIGCAISIACLLCAIIFFLLLGKTLFSSVHYYIHLNLCVSLFCAYLVFVAGVEPARTYDAACKIVAALLHYFWLSAFSWMMCEGVMLYLMLVVVFSKLSKKWWFFMLLGYGIPVPVVVVSLAVRSDEYGVRNSNGSLVYCWLSTANGVIWAFVAPMLLIISINVFFMVTALVTVFRTTRRKFGSGKKTTDQNVKLFKTLFMASIVLLPLMGVTWILGLFVVNQDTTVFAWLFTIFNSLQGAFIFIFHVVRSDKVWRSPRVKKMRDRTSITFASTFRRSETSGATIKMSNPVSTSENDSSSGPGLAHNMDVDSSKQETSSDL